MSRAQTPRIADVARRARVSLATVSRALNGKSSVDPTLAARVHAAATELGYRPNHAARNLRARSSTVWGIVVADITNPFFTRIVRAVQDAAWKERRTVIVCNTDEDLDRERGAIDVLVAEGVGGVIIAPASETATDVRPLIDRGIPVVAIDRRLPTAVDCVLVDNVAGGRAATEHLLGAGARHLACITGPRDTTTARERLLGFRQVLAAAGAGRGAFSHADYREDGGRAALLRWIREDRLPDGVFVANNLMTLGVLRAAYEQGIGVPGDLRVVGFDELPWGGGVAGQVPVVVQPTTAMAEAAVAMLARREAGDRGPARNVVLTPRLHAPDWSAKLTAVAGLLPFAGCPETLDPDSPHQLVRRP
ncbi:MAG TPA: LacI family DNA-binding transcriptional regulator [Candidatus Dormibacteraeota bacterium]|nr:LacI family DNA-binding transcriptional regulator [Candidatus Dormibacteraeota bacterium]